MEEHREEENVKWGDKLALIIRVRLELLINSLLLDKVHSESLNRQFKYNLEAFSLLQDDGAIKMRFNTNEITEQMQSTGKNYLDSHMLNIISAIGNVLKALE